MWEAIAVIAVLFGALFVYSTYENIKVEPPKKRKILKIIFWSVVLPIGAIIGLISFFIINDWWQKQTEVSQLGWGIFVGGMVLIYSTQKLWDARHAELKKATSYRCSFTKRIYPHPTSENSESKLGNDDEIILEQNRVHLPFPPFIGLYVSDLLNKEEIEDENGLEYWSGTQFYSGRITQVRWDGYSECFHCEVDPYQLSETNKLGGILYHHVVGGWKISGYAPEAKKALEDWQKKEKEKNSSEDV